VNPEDFGKLYALAALAGAVFTLKTIGAEEARRHPLAAALTAAVCGLLWPALIFFDVFPKNDDVR
jgi:hypothetical protein